MESFSNFEVLNYQPSGESCLEEVRGFFVALLFSSDIPNTVVASFPNGLNTIALGWVEHGLRAATVFFCAVRRHKRSIKPCQNQSKSLRLTTKPKSTQMQLKNSSVPVGIQKKLMKLSGTCSQVVLAILMIRSILHYVRNGLTCTSVLPNLLQQLNLLHLHTKSIVTTTNTSSSWNI